MEHARNSGSKWRSRAEQIQRLSILEEQIAAGSDAMEARIDRAALLNAMDRRVEAKQALVEVLLHEPTNLRALIELGNLLSSMGHNAAACRVYVEAIEHHPNSPVGHINLANLLLLAGNYESARDHYKTALTLDPRHPQAHQGLGAALSATGDRASAVPHFRAGFSGHSVVTLPYRGPQPPLPLLRLVSSGDGNIPTASFLDDRIFMTTVVVADFHDPSIPLPPHQLIFNAIGDADLCTPALDAAARLIKQTSAPVINHPSSVLKTARAANVRRLNALRNVRAPKIVQIPRTILAGPGAAEVLSRHGFAFPLLLRSPGFHTGRNFLLLNDITDLPAAIKNLPGRELLAIEYLDARGRDGNARKYRAMFVDGHIFPLHTAISRHWKVHYFTADMADNPKHRVEDAAFLNDMESTIGSKAMAALSQIRDILALDYGGIDFGIGPLGEVLVFEANATMVVNPPDSDERWDYRRPAVDEILDAVKSMIVRTASSTRLRNAG